jgi:hypothetical protein
MKLFSIIILIILTQSCVKENSTQSYNPKNYYFYLTTAQINQTPYFTNPAFDTISFASDKGDTLTFVKTKTDTNWYCERTTSNPDNNDQNCYQTVHNTYATIKGNGSFDVKHWKQGFQFINGIEININNMRFLYGDYQVGLKNYWTFKNFINMNNKNFIDLIVLYPDSYDSLRAAGYINKDYGLFYFDEKIKTNKWVINN